MRKERKYQDDEMMNLAIKKKGGSTFLEGGGGRSETDAPTPQGNFQKVKTFIKPTR